MSDSAIAIISLAFAAVALALTVVGISWRMGVRLGQMTQAFTSFCERCDLRMGMGQDHFDRLDAANIERDKIIHDIEIAMAKRPENQGQ